MICVKTSRTFEKICTAAKRIYLHGRVVFRPARAFAVKVDTKRLPVFLFSGVDLYHDFRNDAFCGLYNLLNVRNKVKANKKNPDRSKRSARWQTKKYLHLLLSADQVQPNIKYAKSNQYERPP